MLFDILLILFGTAVATVILFFILKKFVWGQF